MQKEEVFVAGIMNGTSLDGVDIVLAKGELRKRAIQKFSFVGSFSVRFPKRLAAQLWEAVQHRLKVDRLAELHHELGRFYGKSMARAIENQKWRVDLVGLHGQTVYHRGGFATFQIGEPSYMAYDLRLPVVSQFRGMDIAAGGQGAPLATALHRDVLASQASEALVAFHNLGGISNLTLIDNHDHRLLWAFDTGPANMLMDLAVQKATEGRKHFDRDGKLGSQGLWDPELVEKALKHPYFRKKPPKTCGREEFGAPFLKELGRRWSRLDLKDQVATGGEIAARSIAQAYQKLPRLPEAIYCCGGGANNPFLLHRLQYHLPEVRITTTADLGWPVSSIEGGAFAYLALCQQLGAPARIDEATGAKEAVVLGQSMRPQIDASF